MRDLDIRATLIANAIQDPLEERLSAGRKEGRANSSTAFRAG